MNAYIYNADIYCEDCGEQIRKALTAAGKAPANPSDEYTYDSDTFPKGPYPDGGGESDSPCHCAAGENCINAIDTNTPNPPGGWGRVGAMLDNPLTNDGVDYIVDAFNERDGNPVTCMWFDFYAEQHGVKKWGLYFVSKNGEPELLGARYYSSLDQERIADDLLDEYWSDDLDAAACSFTIEEMS